MTKLSTLMSDFTDDLTLLASNCNDIQNLFAHTELYLMKLGMNIVANTCVHTHHWKSMLCDTTTIVS